MVVHGGLSAQQMYLQDLMALNLDQQPDLPGQPIAYRWSSVYCRGDMPGGLAFHTCQLVLHHERYKMAGAISLSSLPDVRHFREKVSPIFES
jgi:hypothetical protein